MKKIIIFLLMIFLTSISLNGLTQNSVKEKGLEAITMNGIKGSLEFLASDWTEGRETGERGSFMAADYIQSMFKVYGIQPAGDITYARPTAEQRAAGIDIQQVKGYFQDFSLVKSKSGTNQVFELKRVNGTTNSVQSFEYLTDFSYSTPEVSQSFETEIVFVGYGYMDKDKAYDDYKNVDVKGK